jgi:hypothetical protein
MISEIAGPSHNLSSRTGGARRWRLAVAAALVGVVVVAFASPVAAHVTITSAATSPEGVTAVQLRFDHGCGPAPTVAMDLRVPAGAELDGADLPDGWTASPVNADSVLRLAGPPIPDGQTVSFEVRLRGYDTGSDHLVPTIQECEGSDLAWIDPDQAAAYPAPLLAATTGPTTTTTTAPAAVPEPIAGEPSDGSDEGDTAGEGEVAAPANGDSSTTPWVVGGVAVAAAVAAGAWAVARQRRTGVS